jgi:thioredoxin reductase
MRHDVVIVGGSFAGLSAAIYLARARRTVCVLDTGMPRNRFAPHSHGFFGQDGSEPRTMIALARSQVSAYPTATFVQAEAVSAARAARAAQGFQVRLAGGEELESAFLVLAFGISDELPAIPGLAERWGKSVLHCPYCHGYEFSGRRLGVLHMSPRSVHQAMLVAEWGPLTLFLNGSAELDDASRAELVRRGIAIEAAPVTALLGDDERLSDVQLEDGRTRPIDALYLAPRTRLNSSIAVELGCDLEEGPLGSVVRTDDDKQTTVPGVYAAGDITRAMHNVTFACADGVTAGTAVHRALVF